MGLVLYFIIQTLTRFKENTTFGEDNMNVKHKKNFYISVLIIQFMQCATFEMFPRFEGPFFHIQCK